jgi:EAL domain-containing protein (putative c-di-GMP-specific phosphodiesterase class I)
MALYRAKAEGRGTYRFFAVEMDAQIQARRSMELELREALGRRQLEVFYQPIIDLHAEGVSGFEALLRWRHPLLGMISPTQFVPLAEELGLIVPIGEWVFHEAFREAATWPDHLKVAVNLSPMQFRSENLVPAIEQALTLAGLLANRVEFEITETALLENNDAVLAILHRLRELGLRTALDDFGTGYSSLSYLRSFPFDKLKIDQSFVREMAFRSDCRIIVNSVADLARRLGIVTTAEGVETPEQLEQVRAAGCAEAQGYLFDAALPANEIRNWFSPGFAKSSFRILGRIDGLNPGKHESQGDDGHSPGHSPHQHPWLSRVAQAGVLPDQVLGPMPLGRLPGHLGYAPNVTGVPTVERRTRPGISARAIS